MSLFLWQSPLFLSRRAAFRRRRPRCGAGRRHPAIPSLVERLETRTLLSATALHHYDLNDSLADALGGPSLVSQGGTLDGERYVFGANQGLQLTGGLADTGHYSIVVAMEYDSTSPLWKKLLDFQGLTGDPGLYVRSAQLLLYPASTAGPDAITPDVDFHLALTRDASTGEVKGYLNGVLQWTFTGTVSNAAVSANNVLTFFQDDTRTGGREAQSGSADFITIYDGPLTAEEVLALANSHLEPPNSEPSLTVDDAAVTVDEGDSAMNSGQFDDVDPSDSVVITASVGTITQDPGNSGNWSWSYDAADGPAEGQTVVVTADDGNGGVTTASFELTVENVAPAAYIDGPDSTFKGDAVQFTIGASDASAADQQSGFQYDVDWNGDGTVDLTIDGAAERTVSHVFTVAGPTTVILTATDKNGGTSVETTHSIDIVQRVDVDIQAGRKDHINLNSIRDSKRHKANKKIAVVLFTTSDFDASTVDLNTVRWAGAKVDRVKWKDVDRDGDRDLVLRFRLRDTNLLEAYREALATGNHSSRQRVSVELTGTTTAGVNFLGSDDVCLFQSGKALRETLDKV